VRIAVLGAGVCGLVAAHRLSQAGHECVVYERWPGLGGQAATLDVGGGHLLERYYHHLFTSDVHIAALYDELGMPDELEWRTSSVAFFAKGRLWPFVTPMDLLRFGPLPPLARVRMGAAALAIQRFAHDREPYEHITAREWIRKRMGRHAWEHVWGPLLRGKFGERADDIAMVWLWGKLRARRQIKGDQAREEKLGYPRQSWEKLFEVLRDRIEAAGGRVLIDRPAAQVRRAGEGFEVVRAQPGSFRRGHDPRAFETDGEPERFDAVLSTLPNDVFEQVLAPELAAEVGEEYLGRARSIEYFAALCLLLELDRPFSPYYWTNVADPSLPFVGLIEHTNFIEPERYGGRRFLYVANYLPHGHELLELEPEQVIEHYTPGLRKVNPDFDASWIRERWMFREPAAQPIVTRGYVDRIPPMRTPARGLWLANTTQVYPEDRGTNYAVRLGDDVAAAMLAG
jgi:protoporphyrinogen oxidase